MLVCPSLMLALAGTCLCSGPYHSLVCGMAPSPACPTATMLTKALYLNLISSPSWALHLLPVCTIMPAASTWGSLESYCSSASFLQETLNSLLRLLKGSWSFLLCLYKPRRTAWAMWPAQPSAQKATDQPPHSLYHWQGYLKQEERS